MTNSAWRSCAAARVGMRMRAMDDAEEFYDDDWSNDTCWNCGGTGFVSDCFEEYACLYPEDGCDLCTRRCDDCRPRKPSP